MGADRNPAPQIAAEIQRIERAWKEASPADPGLASAASSSQASLKAAEGAAGLRNLLAKLLFGVGGIDPAAYGFAALALAVVAIAASVVPCWRAAATDPARALQAR